MTKPIDERIDETIHGTPLSREEFRGYVLGSVGVRIHRLENELRMARARIVELEREVVVLTNGRMAK